MYRNIGGKIKALAIIFFISMTAMGELGALYLLFSDEEMILPGLLLMQVVPVVCWVASWFIYGFGELISKACEIANNTRISVNPPQVDSERLSRIEALRAQGLITEEEYQRALNKQ